MTIHPTVRPLPQKIIGVLGGMSNQATGEYYRLLNDGLNARLGGWDNGEIVIVSVNFGNIEHFVRTGDWNGAERYLSGKVDALERAGADLVICVSNTMHRVVEPIMAGRSIPFIHIADPTGEAIAKAGLQRVGLLGTAATMRSDLLAERFRDRFGIELLVPDEADQATVDRIIFDELVRRDLRPDSKAEYLRIVEDLRRRGAGGVILGCTEIFLLIDQPDLPGFPVFDTTRLHTQAAVDFVSAGG
ncbi:amino acid racemase [Azospirillum sp. TSH64]|uniref:aspartate/glutamate racemase family protein n=1 Tax=Azospirillum sp. TSH64 TaxID=652740 RepID=UPI000D60F51E|nr:amino acid racemase [Azospirillum sp. TSH64]PWC77227.1 aspartate racemase [Azospirillum sp. TSH64]